MPRPTLFQNPLAFWAGSLLVTLGVFSHLPMFMMGQHTHWQMVGMPMTLEMWVGMALIPPRPGAGLVGLAAAAT